MTLDERIRECWDTLFVLNHELGMDGVFSLANGASAETLAQAEHDLGFALPEEIREGCRFSNGVSWPWEGVCFAPAEKLAESIVKHRREVIECPPFRCEAGTKSPQFGKSLVPFASYDLRAWLEGEIASLKQADPKTEPQDETMNIETIDTRVILDREKLPLRQAWQDAIRAHGFDLELDAAFDPDGFSGFLPSRFEGAVCGFQYSVGPLDRSQYNEVELRDIGARGHVVTFGVPLGSGLESMACASIASAVLCEMTDGLLSDIGDFTAAKDAITKARKGLGGMNQLQKMADFAHKEGMPEEGAVSQAWMDKLKADTGITLPLIPFRVPAEQREAPAPVPKVRTAAAPGSLAALWYEIEDLNRARGVDVDEKFARGSNEEELRYFEGRIGHFIPDDLRELFLACSGFEDPWPCEGRDPVYVDLTFVLWGIQDETLAPSDGSNDTHAAIRNRDLITLEARGGFFEAAIGPCLCYDRTPGAAGRIVEVECGKGTYRVVAPSLRAWLEVGLKALKRNARGAGHG